MSTFISTIRQLANNAVPYSWGGIVTQLPPGMPEALVAYVQFASPDAILRLMFEYESMPQHEIPDLRDQLAMAALANPFTAMMQEEFAAKQAYRLADAMLEVRRK